MNFIIELLRFLKQRGKLWMAPLIFIFIIIGGLLVLSQGSVFSPFIYTLF